ncbi:MAG: creatininase family protein, partial [Actinomycetes bacterium]
MLVVVPLGSWEQHGPHLPPDTDSVIISAVVAAAAGGREGITVAPTLGITASDEHAGFGGTLSIGTEATAAAVVAIARSASWASGVLFANGHGGNADA